MAHKTRIGGTGYDAKSGRTRIAGTGYNIKKGRTLIGGTGYNIGFEIPAGELDIGASVFTNVDGVRTEFLVVHQGTLPTDNTNYNDAADGTWLMTKDIYTLSVYGSTWPYTQSSCTVANYCANTFPGLFDSDILSLFKSVMINPQYSFWSGLACKFFIPRVQEIVKSNDQVFDYFNNTDAAKRIAYYDGVATEYWTRTTGSSGSTSETTFPYAHIINAAGEDETKWNDISRTRRGIRPVGILSADAIIDSDFNIIAS